MATANIKQFIKVLPTIILIKSPVQKPKHIAQSNNSFKQLNFKIKKERILSKIRPCFNIKVKPIAAKTSINILSTN